MCDAYKTVGTKGSDVYDSTGSSLLDLSVRLVRSADAKDIRDRIREFSSVDSPRSRARLVDAFVLAFHTRNVRGGKGERDLFQELFVELYLCHPMDAVRVLTLIPKYGCWRDLFELASLSLKTDCCSEESLALVRLRHDIVGIAAAQLRADFRDEEGSPISLCAKWAPRERDVLAKYVAQAYMKHVGAIYTVGRSYSCTMRYYRKTLSHINKKLGTVEVPMCSGAWASIDPKAVPGRAGALYKRALLNLPSTWTSTPNPVHGGKPIGKHVTPAPDGVRKPDDSDRVLCADHFKTHYAAAAKGQAKVHGADTLYPHEVVKEMATSVGGTEGPEKDHLLAVWRSMVAKAKEAGGLGRSIFMSDFSGSMQSAGKAGDTPYWVSMALGLLGAEVCADEFKDRLMTFQSEPSWHTFRPEDDLFKRICSITHSCCGQGTSTDFQKAMDLVLATLKEKRIRPGQEPENLIVLTDMAFDEACGSSEISAYTGHRYRHVVKTAPWETHITMIQESFRRAGEDMWGPGQGFKPPRIVIWNLAASPKDIHAKADQPGVAMLSGWSPSQFKVLCEAGPQPLTPLDILRLELDDPQYDAVREALRGPPESAADFDLSRWSSGRL